MTVIAHHICFWVTVCWALNMLHHWGLESLSADAQRISRMKMPLGDTLWQGLAAAGKGVGGK